MCRYALGLWVAMIIVGADLNPSYAAQPDPVTIETPTGPPGGIELQPVECRADPELRNLPEPTEPQVRVVGAGVSMHANIPPTANLHRAGSAPGAGSLPLEFDARLFGSTFVGFAVMGDTTRYCLGGSFEMSIYTAHGDGAVPSSVPASGFVGGLSGDSSHPVAGVFLSDSPTQPGPTGRFSLADPGGQIFPALGQPFYIGGGTGSDDERIAVMPPEGATRLFVGLAGGNDVTAYYGYYSVVAHSLPGGIAQALDPDPETDESDVRVALSIDGEQLRAGFAQTLSVEITGEAGDEGTAGIVRLTIDGRMSMDPEAEFTHQSVSFFSTRALDGCENVGPAEPQQGAATLVLECPLDLEADDQLLVDIVTPEADELFARVEVLEFSRASEPLAQLEDRFEIDRSLGSADYDVPERVEIVSAITVSDQLGRDEFGDLKNYYPYRRDGRAAFYHQRRTILIVGRDLPERRSEASIESIEDGAGISYVFNASVESLRPEEWESSLLGTGLKRMFGEDADVDGIIRQMRADGLSAILVDAQLEEGVLPGERQFSVNGAPVTWLLQFADANMTLDFVRYLPGNAAEGEDALNEALQSTFLGDQTRLEARISPIELPVSEIRAYVWTQTGGGSNAARSNEQVVTLERVEAGVFRSQPLQISGPGGEGISVSPSDTEFSYLVGRLDPEQAASQMPFAAGHQAVLSLENAPDTLRWDRHLSRAMACSGVDGSGFPADEAAFLPMAFDDDDPLENLIIVNLETVTQDIRIGHHAGVLFLREELLRASSDQEAVLSRLLDSRQLRTRKYLSWREALDSPFLEAPTDPLFNMVVPHAPLQAEGPQKLRDLVRFDRWMREGLRAEGYSDNQISDWMDERIRLAAEQLLSALRDTARDLAQTDPCAVATLLEYAPGLQTIYPQALPNLVRFDRAMGQWRPDLPARRWTRSAVSLAETWREQVRASEADTDIVLLYAALFTFPLHFTELAALSAIATVVEIADAATSATSTYQRYSASELELSRSLGLMPVIGEGRYLRAEANQVGAGGVAFEMILAVGSVLFDGADILRAARLNPPNSSVDTVLQKLEQGADLTDAEFEIARAQVTEILLRRQSGNADAFERPDLDNFTPEEQRWFQRLADYRGPQDAPFSLADGLPSDVLGRLAVERGGRRARLPERPESAASYRLTDDQRRLMARQGTSPDGVPRLIPLLENIAPSRQAVAGGSQSQWFIENVTNNLNYIARSSPEGSIENILANQTLQALEDPTLVIWIDNRMTSLGSGAPARLDDFRTTPEQVADLLPDGQQDLFLVRLNPTQIRDAQIRGISWDPTAVLAHELGHMVQVYFQEAMGVTVGRALRETDSFLRQAVIQNAVAQRSPFSSRIDPLDAIQGSLEYALSQQLKAYQLKVGQATRFRTREAFHDGLFQLDHTEFVARARSYFPEASERQILEAFISEQRRGLNTLRNDPLVQLHPLTSENRVFERYEDMIERAEWALIDLGTP